MEFIYYPANISKAYKNKQQIGPNRVSIIYTGNTFFVDITHAEKN